MMIYEKSYSKVMCKVIRHVKLYKTIKTEIYTVITKHYLKSIIVKYSDSLRSWRSDQGVYCSGGSHGAGGKHERIGGQIESAGKSR